MSYLPNLSLMIILSGAFAFAGCSSTTTPTTPEPSASAAATPAPAETKKKVDSGKTTESTTKAPPSSSLDALQRGESTATPASSPLKDVYFDFDRYDLLTMRDAKIVRSEICLDREQALRAAGLSE